MFQSCDWLRREAKKKASPWETRSGFSRQAFLRVVYKPRAHVNVVGGESGREAIQFNVFINVYGPICLIRLECQGLKLDTGTRENILQEQRPTLGDCLANPDAIV